MYWSPFKNGANCSWLLQIVDHFPAIPTLHTQDLHRWTYPFCSSGSFTFLNESWLYFARVATLFYVFSTTSPCSALTRKRVKAVNAPLRPLRCTCYRRSSAASEVFGGHRPAVTPNSHPGRARAARTGLVVDRQFSRNLELPTSPWLVKRPFYEAPCSGAGCGVFTWEMP